MAINRDVEVRCRISILSTEVMDENDPAGRRGGRRGRTETRIVDIPKTVIDNNELIQRAADIADIILHGYELEGTTPSETITEEATGIIAIRAVLHGRVLPNTNTSCGFLYGATKELTHTHDADQSIIAAASDTLVPITYTLVGLTTKTRYYFRAWSKIAACRTKYGRIKSFVTL